MALEKSGENYSLNLHGRLDGGWKFSKETKERFVKFGAFAGTGVLCIAGGWAIAGAALIMGGAISLGKCECPDPVPEQLSDGDYIVEGDYSNYVVRKEGTLKYGYAPRIKGDSL